jgi:Ser/Thr protein kinase RdoA (MazF antagonist)
MLDPEFRAHPPDAAGLRGVDGGWYRGRMSLRTQALQEFDLPAAPQRIDDFLPVAPELDCCRVHAPAGRFLLLCGSATLSLAFEATLFDLLAESRYPAPRPRRARRGSFIAPLASHRAAACYGWPAGEQIEAATASIPQLMEVGRLLARLHQLGETHPAAVADPCDARALLGRAANGPERDALEAAVDAPIQPLPSGAGHGGLTPRCALFIGDRCSAVLPSGLAGSGPLALDLAETAVGWLEQAQRPAAALRAIASGYQALRRLSPDERDSFLPVLRFAAAREGARRLATGRPSALAPLQVIDEIGHAEVRSAAG